MINIDFINNTNIDCDFDKNKTQILSKKILDELKFTAKDVTIEVLFVEKNQIKDLNKKFLNINKPTDVLSFPQEYIDESPEKLLGSIIISPQIANETNQKCVDLYIHGILHLLGYDHEKNKREWSIVEERIIKII